MDTKLPVLLIFLLVLTFPCAGQQSESIVPAVKKKGDNKQLIPENFQQNTKLGRGINIGNALEAPVDGTWGVTIQESFFKLIADQKFNSVRIPINWSTENRTGLNAPYTVSEQFFSRIDWVIANALKNKLSVVICMHHYNEFYASPKLHKQRYLAIWNQISNRYKNYTDSLYFEPLNEPHDSIDATLWNSIFPEVLSVIRANNPTRTIIVGPVNYNDPYKLDLLVLPNDSHLILTVHDYMPFMFTHQGADWVTGSDAWLGTTWDNLESQRQYITEIFTHVKQYADAHSLPVYVGEFGAYEEADIYSRRLWTNYTARNMEKSGFSWAYWEFCWIFGVYDRKTGAWKEKLTNALMNDSLYPSVRPNTGNNMVKSDFSTGLSPWYLDIKTPAAASAIVADSICHVITTNLGVNNYDIQLTRPNIALEKGKNYTVSFQASASANKNIIACMAKNSDPWNNYSSYNDFTITNTPQTFNFDFTMSEPSDLSARLSFVIGTSGSDFYLSKVEIIEQYFRVAEIDVEAKDSITAVTKEGSLQFYANVYPIKSVNKNVVWSVQNITGSATITNNGLLTAGSKQGTVKVSATSEENTAITGNKIITITSPAGIDEQKSTMWQCYPNPAVDFLFVKHASNNQNEAFEIMISDLTGKSVLKNKSKANQVKIPVYSLPNGIYLVTVKDMNGLRTFKIVISH